MRWDTKGLCVGVWREDILFEALQKPGKIYGCKVGGLLLKDRRRAGHYTGGTLAGDTLQLEGI